MAAERWSQKTTHQLKQDVRAALRALQTGALIVEELRDGKHPMYSYSDWTDAAEALWSAAGFIAHLYERLRDSEEQAAALANLNMALMDGGAA